MWILVILGILYPLHIARGWRLRRNRLWGFILVFATGILILTGYLLYYAPQENVRALVSSAHLWVGLSLPLIVVVHVVRGRSAHDASGRDDAERASTNAKD